MAEFTGSQDLGFCRLAASKKTASNVGPNTAAMLLPKSLKPTPEQKDALPLVLQPQLLEPGEDEPKFLVKSFSHTHAIDARPEVNPKLAGSPVGDDRVVKTVPPPETRLLEGNLLFSAEGNKPLLGLLRTHLSKEGRLEKQTALELIEMGTQLVAKEPNILHINTPVIIVGDLHGQFYDLLAMLDSAGGPLNQNFLFLGDYVDRGDFSTEIVFFLLALKITFPDKVFLLRGNHESRLMCEYMTFLLECEYKYDEEVYDAFMKLFDCLPLAAILHGGQHGLALCMHGGIGPDIKTIDDIAKLYRFSEPPSEGALCDLLWSDPVNEWNPEDFEDISKEDWAKIKYIDNVPRHTSFFYGRAALEPFLTENNLTCIIRGHQVQDAGFMRHFFGAKTRALPMCYTVFSAPNYCDQYGNSGAFMKYMDTSITMVPFKAASHPFNLPDFIDCFTYSIPTLLENIVVILQKLVIQLKDDGPQMSEAEQQSDEMLKKKCIKLFANTERAVKQRTEIAKTVAAYEKLEKQVRFEQVVRADRNNEALPRGFRRTFRRAQKKSQDV